MPEKDVFDNEVQRQIGNLVIRSAYDMGVQDFAKFLPKNAETGNISKKMYATLTKFSQRGMENVSILKKTADEVVAKQINTSRIVT